MPDAARPTSRTRPRRQPDRYLALLVFILIDCVVVFAVDTDTTGRWLPTLAVAVTVLVGLQTSAVKGRWVNPARAAAALLIVLSAVAALSDSTLLVAWIFVGQALLLAVLVIAIIGRVISHDRVTGQTILGVICIYVLFGLIFAFAAFGLSGVEGHQFFVQNATPTPADFLYFSFVVLTTVGFGDLTPATEPGRAMVSFEALLGQIFLVTMVSRLVSLYSGSARRLAQGGSDEAAGPQPAE